jgi:betaine-aldehyde dehydrogenase
MPKGPYSNRRLFYDGIEQDSKSDQLFETLNPATGKLLAHVQQASHEDIDAAVLSAQNAFPSWSKTPPIARGRILLKAVQLLREQNDLLAKIETEDTGKPFSETSTVDIVTGADVVEYFANLVSGGALNGETVQLRGDAWAYTTKEPLGVCIGIGAFNYPAQICLWKLAPCLAAGNTMVYKASEITPLHGLFLAKLLTDAGLPPGVFNVVNGDGSIGSYLTAHPSVAKVSFTGSVPTGQKVASSAASRMKYMTMELGGKSPLIVCEDADIETAVDGAMMANFFSSGQVCTNGTRVFIPESKMRAFEKTLLSKMPYIRMGNPMDPSTNFGPLVSESQLTKVFRYINHGVQIDHANLLYGDDPISPFHGSTVPPDYRRGYWIKPTIFTDCTDDMRITRDEIFGPVMCLLPYKTLEEAITRANSTTLGLAAGVFTKNLTTAHQVIPRLDAGITWVNTWGESPAEMSVGGWKMSGMGVENGRRGIEAWVRCKSTLVDMSGKVATVFTKKKEEVKEENENKMS